jgi:ankyrin repeat protein
VTLILTFENESNASAKSLIVLDRQLVFHLGSELHLAALLGLAKVAAMLLKVNPSIDAMDETGNTALAVAM